MKLLSFALLASIAFSFAVVNIDSLGTYPGYDGDVNPQGSVEMTFANDYVKIIYQLSGLEDDCRIAGDASNSCGIHIHSGTTCDDADSVGGHYFVGDDDPWAKAVYSTKSKQSGSGVTFVEYGYQYSKTAGRAFVLHKYDGGRVTCNLIPAVVALTNFSPYPGYDGRMRVFGDVQLSFSGTSVEIEYSLVGLEGACSKPGDAANSCGIHIHSGTTCDDADQVGGHYFKGDTDVWSPIVYKSNFIGYGNGKMSVDYGYGFDTSVGRAFVIHAYDGSRVTCNLIPGLEESNSNKGKGDRLKNMEHLRTLELTDN